MRCLICRKPAVETQFEKSGKTFDCPAYDGFSVSGSAIQAANKNVWFVNEARAKDWFTKQRAQGSGSPAIEVAAPIWD